MSAENKLDSEAASLEMHRLRIRRRDVADELEAARRVVTATRKLFATLDHVDPYWREETLILNQDSDEVNAAWVELASALERTEEQ